MVAFESPGEMSLAGEAAGQRYDCQRHTGPYEQLSRFFEALLGNKCHGSDTHEVFKRPAEMVDAHAGLLRQFDRSDPAGDISLNMLSQFINTFLTLFRHGVYSRNVA